MSAETEKQVSFAEIVRLRAAAYAAQYAPPKTDTDAIEDLQQHLGMLEDNDLDNVEPRVMLENLAELMASAERLRDHLLGQMTKEEVATLHAEVVRG